MYLYDASSIKHVVAVAVVVTSDDVEIGNHDQTHNQQIVAG